MSTQNIDQFGEHITLMSIDGRFQRSYQTLATIDYKPSTEKQPAGMLYKQEVTTRVKMSPDDIALFDGRKIMVKFKTLRGTEVTWGDQEEPVRCMIIPYMNVETLQLERKSTTPMVFQ